MIGALLPITVICVMYDQLGAEDALRVGRFQGSSFYVARVIMKAKVICANLPLLRLCCCQALRRKRWFGLWLAGQGLPGDALVETHGDPF